MNGSGATSARVADGGSGKVVGALAIVGVPYILLQALAPTAIPAISDEFGVSVGAATWLLTAYLISASVMTPLAGRIGDLVGKRRVLLVVLLTLATGTVVSAAAPDLPVLILGRLLQGAGAAAFPLAYGLIRETLPADRVPGGIGVVASTFGIGGFIGISLAGPLIDLITYHGLFLFCGAIAVIAAAAVFFFVPPDSDRKPLHIPLSGAVWMTLALTTILLPLGNGNDWGWLSPQVLALFAFGALATTIWIRSELRAEQPLVDMRVLAVRPVWTANLATVLLGFGMFAGFVFYPQLMVAHGPGGFGLGISLAETGLLFLPSSCGSIISARVSSRFYHRVGGRRLIAAGMASTAFSIAMIGVLNTVMDSHFWTFLIFGFTSGLGTGTSLASLTTYLLESVPSSHTAVVTGINSIARTAGGAVGSQAAAAMIAIGATSVTETITPTGLVVGTLTASAVVFSGVFVMLRIAPEASRQLSDDELDSAPEPIPMLAPEEKDVAAR
jgi:MFS family permease